MFAKILRNNWIEGKIGCNFIYIKEKRSSILEKRQCARRTSGFQRWTSVARAAHSRGLGLHVDVDTMTQFGFHNGFISQQLIPRYIYI